MRAVNARWVAAIGMMIALGSNLSAVVHAQDDKSITDQEACQRMKTLLPLAHHVWEGSHGVKIEEAHLTPTGFTFRIDKKPDISFAYADVVHLDSAPTRIVSALEIFTQGRDRYLVLPLQDRKVPALLAAAIMHLANDEHEGMPCDCTGSVVDPKAELDSFAQKTAAWRANNPKPPPSDEVTKKRLLAEDAIQEKNLDAAVKYYRAGVSIDPTWSQGWYNAALISAEMKNYPAAAFYMKHYLILLPDAPDSAAAKEKLLLWQAKAEEAGK